MLFSVVSTEQRCMMHLLFIGTLFSVFHQVAEAGKFGNKNPSSTKLIVKPTTVKPTSHHVKRKKIYYPQADHGFMWTSWRQSKAREGYIKDFYVEDDHERQMTEADRQLYLTTMKVMAGVTFGGIVIFVLIVSATRSCRKAKKKTYVKAVVSSGDKSEMPWISQEPIIRKQDLTMGWSSSSLGHNITYSNQKTLLFTFPTHKEELIERAYYKTSFNEGRHIMAFLWSADQRRFPFAHARVGLAMAEEDPSFDMYQGIGDDWRSMGLDLIQRKLYYNGKVLDIYPKNQYKDKTIPSLLYMYMDFDKGLLGFGSSSQYLGTAFDFSTMQKSKSIQAKWTPVISASGMEGKLMTFYKGLVPSTSDSMHPVPSTSSPNPSSSKSSSPKPSSSKSSSAAALPSASSSSQVSSSVSSAALNKGKSSKSTRGCYTISSSCHVNMTFEAESSSDTEEYHSFPDATEVQCISYKSIVPGSDTDMDRPVEIDHIYVF